MAPGRPSALIETKRRRSFAARRCPRAEACDTTTQRRRDVTAGRGRSGGAAKGPLWEQLEPAQVTEADKGGDRKTRPAAGGLRQPNDHGRRHSLGASSPARGTPHLTWNQKRAIADAPRLGACPYSLNKQYPTNVLRREHLRYSEEVFSKFRQYMHVLAREGGLLALDRSDKTLIRKTSLQWPACTCVRAELSHGA